MQFLFPLLRREFRESPKKISSLSLRHANILDEGMTITDQENCNSSMEMNFLGKREVSAKDMEVKNTLSESLSEPPREMQSH